MTEDVELDTERPEGLTGRFKELFEEETGEDFPQDPQEQLRQAIVAVFDSWTGKRAVEYRRINHIPDDWGTAVNVQQMVFGNKGDSSCSGVAFSRDEITGEPTPSGDFLPNAQGEDVVSGVRTPRDIHEMKESMPEAYGDLMDILRTLERHYGDMQDTEFTVEEGSLYMLQTRNAKRPAQAAVRFAVDAVEEGLLDKREAIATIDAAQARRAAPSRLQARRRLRRARRGRGRLARRREGRDRLHRRRRRPRRRGRPRRDPRAPVHRGRRRGRLPRREGHPHGRGRQGEPRRARGARDGEAVRVRRLGTRHRPAREDAQRERHAARRGRPDRDRRLRGRRHRRRRAARGARGVGPLRDRPRPGPTSSARSACAPTPTRPRTPAERASSAPRASASAAPSTCSWPRTASRRCGR